MIKFLRKINDFINDTSEIKNIVEQKPEVKVEVIKPKEDIPFNMGADSNGEVHCNREPITDKEKEWYERFKKSCKDEEVRRAFLWEAIHQRLLTVEEMKEASGYGKFLNTSEPHNDDDRISLWNECQMIQMRFMIEEMRQKLNAS